MVVGGAIGLLAVVEVFVVDVVDGCDVAAFACTATGCAVPVDAG
jgi:hypothetical protein